MIESAVMDRPKSFGHFTVPVYSIGKLTIDLNRNVISFDSVIKKLSRLERRLLSYFLENTGRLLTNREILSTVWGPEYRQDDQVLRMTISRLRDKLSIYPAAAESIQTHYGLGYIFDP